MDRLAARLSQDSMLMFTAFMSRITTSRYRSCGRPVGLFPEASSPYRRSLGMRPSGMRWTWPIKQSLRCLSSVNMLGRHARDRTSVLGTLSCQDIPRMRQMLLMWKVFRRLSCLAYVVHVSLPYSSVVMARVVHCYFGLHCQLGVGPHACCEARKGCGCLPDFVVDLHV